MLVVDDRNAKDIHRDGDVDAVVRKAIRLGMEPVRAVQMATLNPARYFRLDGYGGIGPGYHANLLVLSDLREFKVDEVYCRGRKVAENGRPLFQAGSPRTKFMEDTFKVRPYDRSNLELKANGSGAFPVVEVVPDQIGTRSVDVRPEIVDGLVQVDLERDVIKIAVIERHKTTGNIGIGLVKGFGMKRGAIGTSIAHDSHNIVVVGVDDDDIFAAAKEIERNRGGLACVVDGVVIASLALPIAGLLSFEPLEFVVAGIEDLERAATKLGCSLPSPYSTLSFLALPVIPELRVTDMGVVDVAAGRVIR
jgi:adenine deaminase|tara:strand:+ start:403 stop:1323 length:921 start_codon:yes stop_codon:yes gene_type:complete